MSFLIASGTLKGKNVLRLMHCVQREKPLLYFLLEYFPSCIPLIKFNGLIK